MAYEWEELAHSLNKLPACCAMLGVVRTLCTTKIPVIDRFYGPEIIKGQHRYIEEALQALVYVPKLELAWKVADRHRSIATLHKVKRITSYRGSYSDWQFVPQYQKDS